jgi:RecG-like helicase
MVNNELGFKVIEGINDLELITEEDLATFNKEAHEQAKGIVEKTIKEMSRRRLKFQMTANEIETELKEMIDKRDLRIALSHHIYLHSLIDGHYQEYHDEYEKVIEELVMEFYNRPEFLNEELKVKGNFVKSGEFDKSDVVYKIKSKNYTSNKEAEEQPENIQLKKTFKNCFKDFIRRLIKRADKAEELSQKLNEELEMEREEAEKALKVAQE